MRYRIRSHVLRHFHMRHNTHENSERVRKEIERLELWKKALSKRWNYHRYREFGGKVK